MSNFRLGLLIFLLPVGACSDGKDRVTDGLSLIRLSGGTRAIVEDTGGAFVVYPSVRKDYQIIEGYVVGFRSKATSSDFDIPEYNQGLGYFTLKVDGLDLNQGMSVKECQGDDVCKRYLE